MNPFASSPEMYQGERMRTRVSTKKGYFDHSLFRFGSDKSIVLPSPKQWKIRPEIHPPKIPGDNEVKNREYNTPYTCSAQQ